MNCSIQIVLCTDLVTLIRKKLGRMAYALLAWFVGLFGYSLIATDVLRELQQGAQPHSAVGTPRWRYTVEFVDGDAYTGVWRTVTGVIEEGNSWRAQARVMREMAAAYPGVGSLGITEWERENPGVYKAKTSPRSTVTGPGYIYLIKGQGETYKIGLSATPATRIRTLGVQLPFPIDVLHLIETDNMLAAEKQLKDRYEAKRVNGEWFQLSEADVAEIKATQRIQIPEVQL